MSASPVAAEGGLVVGAASRRIPVEPGLPGAGLRLWFEPYLAEESPLEIAALVASNDGATLVILAADIMFVPDAIAGRVRAACADVVGIASDNVLLNASHAHSTPPLPGSALSDPTVDMAALERFGAAFLDTAVVAVRTAASARQPARLGAGWGTTPIGVYRRQFDADGRDHLGEVPDRPINRDVGVLRFDDLKGRPLAVLFSYGCHPVLHGPIPRETSSDYPGPARAVVTRNLEGAPIALFLGGCGGDINPRFGIGAEADPRETKNREGTVLGAEVLRVASEIRTNATRGPRSLLHTLEISGWPWLPVEGRAPSRVAAQFRTLALPLSELPTLEVARQIQHDHHARVDEVVAAAAPASDERMARRWAEWSDVLLAAVEAGRDTVDVPIQVGRIGDVAFVAVGMEIFSDTGVTVRTASPFATTLVFGYSNGFHGYLPRAEDLPRGGWSPLGHYALPDLYPQAWLQPTAIGPAAEQTVVREALAMLAAIAD